MKFAFGFLCSLFFSVQAFSQTEISGQVLDETSSPLQLVNISVFHSGDSSLVASAISGKEGRFTFSLQVAGKYLVRFGAIGFTDHHLEFDLDANASSKELGTIKMKTMSRAMENVTVQALRPQIIQKADRMVVNVEGTALAAGSTAFDVLSRSPGVFIDQEGNIQLNGRSGVTIMIDGRLTYLSARELRTYLETMTAENIKNIEIITNPSARFDAEGSSGILNINLKKNDIRGMIGSVYSGYYYNKMHGYSAGGNINYKTAKWSSFLNLDFNRRVGAREATFTRVFYGTQKTTYFDQVAGSDWYAQGPPALRTGFDYTLSPKHSIGIMANVTYNQFTSDFLTETYIGNAPNQPELFIDADNFSWNKHRNYNANLHYQGKLDTLGTLLSADVDVARIRNRSESDFFNYFTELTTNQVNTDFLFTHIRSGFDIYSGRIDFTKPVSAAIKLETGAKASHVVSDNDSKFYFNNSGLVLDPLRTNHFNYRENIYAGYLNFNAKLSDALSLQGGLRAENTVSKGNSLTTGEVTRRNYLDFFPSFFLQQNLSNNYQVNYNYSRRLSRPNYGNLNPFISYRDPYTWSQGNPFLRPQYTHSFGITQTFRKTYILTLGYQLIRDVISELPKLNVDNATTIYYTGNVNDGRNISLTAIAPIRIMKLWEASNTFVLAYNEFKMVEGNMNLDNDQLFWMLQSNHTIQLPSDFKIEVNSGYRGPTAYGLYHIASQWWIHLGFKKSFNKKFDISINANDLFKGQRLMFTTDIAGNINEFDQYFRARNIGLTLRYHFSRGQKIDVNNRNRNLEELNRTN